MPKDSKQLLWDDARVFLAIARKGTLTSAAGLLGSGVATTSRRIDRLESVLGVPLFVRHQTGYRLTDEGEALLPKAEALENAALAFESQADHESDTVGLVRIATAENLANPIIIPSLPVLLARHPQLELEVATDVASVNLHRRDADLALRMVKPERGNVTLRRLATLGFGLYGAQAYLDKRPSGADTGPLDHDSFIGWSEAQSHLPAAQWIERSLRGRAPAITTTTLSAQLSATAAGLGLAILPHFLARRSGLIQLPIDLGVDQSIWLVIHADLAQSRRVRVVADHLAEVIYGLRNSLAGEA
ncbi:LysR family transcriptional regulator [Pelagibius sp. Alg239-R121]|uniref:LysR family transcriptional regulator n=1 Tax=Pelagibius sp. Alg239-R121 TaxID=2993448 RepID=UPI0024A779FA|nr:LysR family transcriptional regulator [Pelagibius sp. Alg239-R121]